MIPGLSLVAFGLILSALTIGFLVPAGIVAFKATVTNQQPQQKNNVNVSLQKNGNTTNV